MVLEQEVRRQVGHHHAVPRVVGDARGASSGHAQWRAREVRPEARARLAEVATRRAERGGQGGGQGSGAVKVPAGVSKSFPPRIASARPTSPRPLAQVVDATGVSRRPNGVNETSPDPIPQVLGGPGAVAVVTGQPQTQTEEAH